MTDATRGGNPEVGSAFSTFEWTLARRYLSGRRRRSFASVTAIFSFLGITVGVATLIVVMSVMNGLRWELLDLILGTEGHIRIETKSGPLVDYGDLALQAETIEGVLSVSPIISGQAMTSDKGRVIAGRLRGVSAENLRRQSELADRIQLGALDEFSGDKVALWSGLALPIGLHVGDKVTLLAPGDVQEGFLGAPRTRVFEVSAIYSIEYDYDFPEIIMPIETAQIFLGMGEAISALEVMVVDPIRSAVVRDRIVKALPDDVRVLDWQQVNSSLVNALMVERNVMFLILTLIVFVAVLNIVSGLVMLVKDKGRDIAILRTMGATRGVILRVFLIAGGAIGVLGTLAGLVIGVVFCWNLEEIRALISVALGGAGLSPELNFLTQLPVRMDGNEVVAVVAIGLTLALLASAYPAWRAARLDPVEALRYE